MLFIVYFLALSLGAYLPNDNFSTLTPSAAPTGVTDYSQSFGIQIETFDAEKAKRANPIQQISDGQIQHQSASTTSESAPTSCVTKVLLIENRPEGPVTKVVSTVGEAKPTESVVNQIGDGQIQNQDSPAPTATASVVNQIGDGQIQNQDSPAPTPTPSVVHQIGDGQIQNQEHPATASVIHQIGDGQIQNQEGDAVSQISDGQIQNHDGANQIGDGQVQNQDSSKLQTCASENALTMTLKDSILYDSHGRIGSIVANRQFQFDGPPPQAGAIYAAGWSISNGYLALGDQVEFYQCKSGDFYNLYDESNAHQCHKVKLAIVNYVDC